MSEISSWTMGDLQYYYKQLNRRRDSVHSLAVLCCEALSCKNCPVFIYNYNTRTEEEKEIGEPCCEQLYLWIKDQIIKEEKEK